MVFPLLSILIIANSFQGCSNETRIKLSSLEEEKLLLSKVEEFNLAFKVCDLEKLHELVTEKYLHTNNKTKAIKKPAWFNYLKKRKLEIQNGILVVNEHYMDEIDLALYDDKAVVTGRMVVSTNKSGKRHENEYRVTHIWIKEDNIWKRAGFHDVRIH